MKWKSIRKNMQWLTKFNVYILLIRSLLNKTAIVFVSLETAKGLQITGGNAKSLEVARKNPEKMAQQMTGGKYGESGSGYSIACWREVDEDSSEMLETLATISSR